MALPDELGISFTPAEVNSMKDAAQTIVDTINSKINFNISNEDRQELSKVGDERAPFVLKSVSDYGVNYSNLNGLAYPHAKAVLDLQTYGQLHEVMSILAQAIEKAEELQMVAGHFCYKFMRDQYDNAARYRGDNVAGAQVVYDGLKGAFEGQGPQDDGSPENPESPTPENP